MSNLRIKQISNAGSSPDSCIVFDGQGNVWRKLHYTSKFHPGDLNEQGVLLVQHNLGRKYVHIAIYDDDDYQVIPDFVKVLDDTSALVGVNSFLNSLTEWTIVAS